MVSQKVYFQIDQFFPIFTLKLFRKVSYSEILRQKYFGPESLPLILSYVVKRMSL